VSNPRPFHLNCALTTRDSVSSHPARERGHISPRNPPGTRTGPRQPPQLAQLAETQHTDHGRHREPPDFASNDPAWAMGLPCPYGPPDFASNDPAWAVGLPPPVLCPRPRKPPVSRATTQHGRWGCHRLASTSTQAPDFAQRPSTGGGAATACPASSLSTQAPRSHKQRPRTQHGRWGCHRLSCVHLASPRFRATTQHGRWGCHRLSCILTVHARPPDLASNDPGPSSPTARLASTSTQAPDFAQRPSTGGGAATACPASSLSTQGPPISRATTQHERWGCHRPSFILHVSCPFRTPGSAVMGGGISTTYLCTSCSHWPPRIDLRPLTGWWNTPLPLLAPSSSCLCCVLYISHPMMGGGYSTTHFTFFMLHGGPSGPLS
jgi:hypothetical protein